MKKVVLNVLVIGWLYGCGAGKVLVTAEKVPIIATLDLVKIKMIK